MGCVLAAFATIGNAGCASETGDAKKEDVTADVDTSATITPRMQYWCTPGESDQVEHCTYDWLTNMNQCHWVYISCDVCTLRDLWYHAGCWVDGETGKRLGP
jgi:hypothetical protein